MIRYWWTVIKRALSNTFHFFGWNRRTIVVPILFIIGSYIHFYRFGLKAMMEEVGVFISYGLIPVSGFTVLLFVFNLVRAPYLIYKEQQGKIDEFSNQVTLDIEISVAKGQAILTSLPASAGPVAGLFYVLIVEVNIINRANQKAILEIEANVELKQDLCYTCRPLTEEHIPMFRISNLLKPIVSLDAKEAISGFFVYSLSTDALRTVGMEKIEDLQDCEFSFEFYEALTKQTVLLEQKQKMYLIDCSQFNPFKDKNI